MKEIFNQSVVQKIKRSTLFKKIQNLVFDKILEDLNQLQEIGFMVNGTPHDCIVYVHKIHKLGVKSEQIKEVIDLIENLYAKFVLLVNLRLSKDFKDHLDFIKSFLRIYKKLKVKNEQNEISFEYFDVLVDGLLEKRYFYGIYLRDTV
jgi:hypothetical protein